MEVTELRGRDETGFPLPVGAEDMVPAEPVVLTDELVEQDPKMDELLELRCASL
ncbi:MAG TPA: hypothetical protein VNE62_05420 [Actinomycetota bacterium]|nr:hypothetical protein [Actinomycetota bacterium]